MTVVSNSSSSDGVEEFLQAAPTIVLPMAQYNDSYISYCQPITLVAH